MPVPIGEVGVYAGSGGIIVAFAMKVIPLLFRKVNGNGKNNSNNGKPGKAAACIKHGEAVHGHEILINQLCKNLDKYEKTAETARTENNVAHEKIFKKLDELK